MKRTTLIIICTICTFFSTSCNANHSSDLMESNKLNDVHTQSIETTDSIQECVHKLSNITLADSFSINIPDTLTKAVTFQRGYYDRKPSNTQFTDFKAVFSYLYPNAPFDEEALYFVGDRYDKMQKEWDQGYSEWLNWQHEQILTGEWDESTPDYEISHPVPDPPAYLSFQDEIKSGHEPVRLFYYDYYLSNLKNKRHPLFLEVSSPVGSDLFRFNRADFVMNQVSEEIGFLETLSPDQFSELVGVYPPDSSETIRLSDKECKISDAVSYFEDYVNQIPLGADPTFDMAVMKVNVLQDSHNHYLYWFVCTPCYQGIPLDYRDVSAYSSQGITRGETGITSLMSGCMINTDSIEYLDGLMRNAPVYNVQQIEKNISASDAIRVISENLSGNVVFAAETLELVYTAEQEDQSDNLEEIRLDTKPSWKLMLYNTNDHQHYVCYVNYEDGKDFRYYSFGDMS